MSKLFYTIALPMPSGRLLHFYREDNFALTDNPKKATPFITLFAAEDYLFELRASAPMEHRDLAKKLIVVTHEEEDGVG